MVSHATFSTSAADPVDRKPQCKAFAKWASLVIRLLEWRDRSTNEIFGEPRIPVLRPCVQVPDVLNQQCIASVFTYLFALLCSNMFKHFHSR